MGHSRHDTLVDIDEILADTERAPPGPPDHAGTRATGIARAHPDAKPDAITTRWLRGAPENPDTAAPAADVRSADAADSSCGETAALHG